MKFKVYHTKSWALNSDLHFIDSEELCPQFVDGYVPVRENYSLIATVETDELGEVFGLTNHIHYEWWRNDGVELVKESRSTSVGDLIEAEDGILYMVASVGFTEVKWSEATEFIRCQRNDHFEGYWIEKF